MNDFEKIVQEYSEDYCLFLEAAYGSSMMSEGGEEAIERMFFLENLTHKTILDIGFGLGGVIFYLAEKYNAVVTGIEINPWMIEEAKRRTVPALKDKVNFIHYHPLNALPFADNHFDIVFSKGVLTHLQEKGNLFNQVHRVLKPGGVFIIDDWLSPTTGSWGCRLRSLCEAEGLTLYAETQAHYRQLLEAQHFVDIRMRDENENYYRYNRDIVNRLKRQKATKTANIDFNQFSIDDAIQSYQLIADSIKDNELLIRWFRAVKPS